MEVIIGKRWNGERGEGRPAERCRYGQELEWS